MPIVTVNIKEGRTLDQKRALVSKMTAAVCETMSVPTSAVRIIINEMADEHFAIGGTLVCDDTKARLKKTQ